MKIFVLSDYELKNINEKEKIYTDNEYIVTRSHCYKKKDKYLENVEYMNKITKDEKCIYDKSKKKKVEYIGCIDKDAIYIIRQKYIIPCEEGIKHIIMIERTIDSDKLLIKKYFKISSNIKKESISKYIKYKE